MVNLDESQEQNTIQSTVREQPQPTNYAPETVEPNTNDLGLQIPLIVGLPVKAASNKKRKSFGMTNEACK